VTLLHSITLSNVRRFAPDVEIGLGAGATILLAPNGSGKTAIFEAMELALTGSVKRLGSNLTPLIRDTMEQCGVRLDFGNAVREVTLPRNGDLTLLGDLGDVFRGVDPQDLPYLLRLTHLLDQCERDWFVQANAIDAGGQLARLPIGRDGAQASTVLTGAKRSATEKHKGAEQRLIDVRNKLTKWLKLLDDRNTSTSNVGRPLEPIEMLSSKVHSLAQLPVDDKGKNVEGLAAIVSKWAEASSKIDRQIESIKEQVGALAAADSLVEEFIAAKAELVSVQKLLEQSKEQRKGVEESLKLAQNVLKSTEVLRSKHEEECRNIHEQLRQVENLANVRAQLVLKEEALSQALEAVSSVEKELIDFRTILEVAQKSADLHRALRLRTETLVRSEQEVSKARKELLVLFENSKELQEQDKKAEAITLGFSNYEKKYQEALIILKDREQEVSEAKAALACINEASDAIREAVGVIATQLAKDRDDCPVCGQVHGAVELQRRISNSLHAMDPSLQLAAERVNQAGAAASAASSELNLASAAMEAVQARLLEVETRRESLRTAILKSQQLFDSGNLEKSDAALSVRAIEIEAAYRSLEADKAAAPVEPQPELLARFSEDMRVVESKLEVSRKRFDEAKTARDFAQELLKSTETTVVGPETMAVLMTKLPVIDANLANAKADIEHAMDERDRKREALDDADASLRRADGLFGPASDRLRVIRSRWLALPMEGDPSADTLSHAKATLENERSKGTSLREELDVVRSELARWEVADAHHRTQREVDETRGVFSEEAYTNLIESEVKSADTEICRITTTASALDTLTSCLSTELSKIHDRILSVAPSWRVLLNRVVREPRFSQTNLDFFSHYRKQHAEVKVPLHGQHAAVADVASEAQMTDLQLTFLLAMAHGHSWSPWRALLLDDPTQHHDLVHAAAVFDVLRDYITDHNFQVVIATHDALQARFFLRKLENDGIPSRLWTLKPTASGVKAFLGN